MGELVERESIRAVDSFRKLQALIPQNQRRRIWLVVASLLVGTVLEIVGIGLLVPLVNLLTRASVSPEDSSLFPIFSLFHARTRLEMLTVGFLTVAAVVLLKNAYLLVSNYLQFAVISKIRRSLEAQMFEKYLRSEYSFHLKSNSVELSRNIVSETDHLVSHAFNPGLAIAVEGLTVIGITALLFYVAPIATISLLVFFIICGVTYTIGISKVVERFGSQRLSNRRDVFRVVAESLSGIKHIKSLNREDIFIRRFNDFSSKYAQLAIKTDLVQRMPAYLVEIWGVVGLLMVVFSMLLQGSDTESVLTVMGLFVGASFRFVPAFNRILISVQTLNLARPAIDAVYSEISKQVSSETSKNDVRITRQLEFHNVSFTYEGSSLPTLTNLSFTITSGSTIGIIGVSGAGKTTFLDLLLGLLVPTSGEISIDGKTINPDLSTWRSHSGYVAQELFLMDDTIKNNIMFGLPSREGSESRLLECLDVAQLTDFVNSLPDGLNTVVGESGVRLSGGQRQRIAIARALYHQPELLVLDEATSALDSETEQKFIEALRARLNNVTLILVSHRLSSLKYCNRIFRVENQVVLESTPI
jgi:ABC-type multidrug transport system fused ATPase/permease subunit